MDHLLGHATTGVAHTFALIGLAAGFIMVMAGLSPLLWARLLAHPGESHDLRDEPAPPRRR